MSVRIWTDEGKHHREEVPYLLARLRGKTIRTIEDGRSDGRGLVFYLSDGASFQVLYEGDAAGVHYMTP